MEACRLQEKWRAEEEQVAHLQQIAEMERREKIAEAARARAIAEERISSVVGLPARQCT